MSASGNSRPLQVHFMFARTARSPGRSPEVGMTSMRTISWIALSKAAPTVIVLCGLAGASTPAIAQQPVEKPNVVFVLADNVGYGDLGAYGGGELRGAPTPRIGQLASEGLRLTQFLVEPSPRASCSRGTWVVHLRACRPHTGSRSSMASSRIFLGMRRGITTSAKF